MTPGGGNPATRNPDTKHQYYVFCKDETMS